MKYTAVMQKGTEFGLRRFYYDGFSITDNSNKAKMMNKKDAEEQVEIWEKGRNEWDEGWNYFIVNEDWIKNS